MKKNFFGLSIALLLISIFTAQPAQALSCGMGTLEQEARASTAIFMGTAQKVSDDGYSTEIKVEKSWKGIDVGKSAKVISEPSLQWGLRFTQGRQYVIFARGHSPYTISVCQRSKGLTSQSDIDNAKTPVEKELYKYAMEQDHEFVNGSGPESLNSIPKLATLPGTQYLNLPTLFDLGIKYWPVPFAATAGIFVLYFVYQKLKKRE